MAKGVGRFGPQVKASVRPSVDYNREMRSSYFFLPSGGSVGNGFVPGVM